MKVKHYTDVPAENAEGMAGVTVRWAIRATRSGGPAWRSPRSSRPTAWDVSASGPISKYR